MRFLSVLKTKAAKACAAVAGVFAATAARAEDPAPSIDLSVATTQLTSMKNAVVSWIEGAAPILAALFGAFLVIVILWVVFKWVKRGVSKS